MTDLKKKTRPLWVKSLINWDEYISRTISEELRSPIIHKVMKWFSNPPGWLWISSLLILFSVVLGTNLTRKRVAVLLFSILLSDQTCNLIKSLTRRIRPYGTGFSFPSSHAANMFTTAVLVANWLPALQSALYIWAVLVGFSRVYLKSHYFFDVLTGALIGVAYALLFRVLFQ